jgi:hypothetical protein
MSSSLSVPTIVVGPPRHSGTTVVIVIVASADWINIGDDNGEGRRSPTVIVVPITKVTASIAAVIIVVFFFVLSCISHIQALCQQRIHRLNTLSIKREEDSCGRSGSVGVGGEGGSNYFPISGAIRNEVTTKLLTKINHFFRE